MYFNVELEEQLSTRIQQNTQRLTELQRLGYKYLATPDDGETWTGNTVSGLEIGQLLRMGVFLGQIN